VRHEYKAAFSDTLSRDELYEQVWSTPMVRLAKEYGLSDVGLAKVCKKHNIPKPPVGYWAKVQAGRRISRPPLHRSVKGDPSVSGFDVSPVTETNSSVP